MTYYKWHSFAESCYYVYNNIIMNCDDTSFPESKSNIKNMIQNDKNIFAKLKLTKAKRYIVASYNIFQGLSKLKINKKYLENLESNLKNINL